MAVTTTKTNKPINPRGNDQSPKGYNRAALYSGKALDFDGVNDSIQVTTIGSVFDYGNAYTMAGYFKIVDAGSGVLMGNNNGNGFANLLGLIYKNGADSNFYPDGNSSNYVTIYSGNTTDFVHIVCTSDGTTAKAYLNGQLVGSTSVSSYTNTSSVFNVGSSLSGNFGESESAGVKVYSTALTAAQVSDLYNNPEKIVPTGVEDTALKLWLPMMEGAGTYCINGVASELVENGEFDNVTGGKPDDFVIVGTETGTNYISASNGQLSIVSDGNYIGVEQYPLTIGKTYNVRIDVESITGPGELSVYLGSGTDYHISSAGIYTIQITATATDFELKRRAGLGAVTAVINSFSIKEVGGVINGATWTHGIGSPVAQTAVIDWNHQSLGGVANILIPQGLTAGRDLLGNLFENVRKQGALNLDGNSWAEGHDNASLDITDAITLEAWVYWDDSSNKGILGRWHSDSSNRNYLLYKSTASNLNFYINTTSVVNVGSISSSKGWTHIVGTYDRTNAIVYIDGVGQTPVAHTAAISTGTLPIEIGRNFTTSNQALTNDIAQPRIYNRALTAEEVQRNYDAGKNIYS